MLGQVALLNSFYAGMQEKLEPGYGTEPLKGSLARTSSFQLQSPHHRLVWY